jgi:hypothetical protein
MTEQEIPGNERSVGKQEMETGTYSCAKSEIRNLTVQHLIYDNLP